MMVVHLTAYHILRIQDALTSVGKIHLTLLVKELNCLVNQVPLPQQHQQQQQQHHQQPGLLLPQLQLQHQSVQQQRKQQRNQRKQQRNQDREEIRRKTKITTTTIIMMTTMVMEGETSASIHSTAFTTTLEMGVVVVDDALVDAALQQAVLILKIRQQVAASIQYQMAEPALPATSRSSTPPLQSLTGVIKIVLLTMKTLYVYHRLHSLLPWS